MVYFVSACLGATNASCQWLHGVMICLNIFWRMGSRPAKFVLQTCAIFYSSCCFSCLIFCFQSTGIYQAASKRRAPGGFNWSYSSALNMVSSISSVWSTQGCGWSQIIEGIRRLVSKKLLNISASEFIWLLYGLSEFIWIYLNFPVLGFCSATLKSAPTSFLMKT